MLYNPQSTSHTFENIFINLWKGGHLACEVRCYVSLIFSNIPNSTFLLNQTLGDPGDGSSSWIPATHHLSSWLLTSAPRHSHCGIWGVTQRMETLSIFLCLHCLSNLKTRNIWKNAPVVKPQWPHVEVLEEDSYTTSQEKKIIVKSHMLFHTNGYSSAAFMGPELCLPAFSHVSY